MGTLLIAILVILAAAFLVALAEAALVMWLWNSIIVMAFVGLPVLKFWVVFAILWLINIVGSAFRSNVSVNEKKR